jgi:hypothetical protein
MVRRRHVINKSEGARRLEAGRQRLFCDKPWLGFPVLRGSFLFFTESANVGVFYNKDDEFFTNSVFWHCSWRISVSIRLPWLRFLRAFSSVVRQMPGYTSQRRGTVRTLPNSSTVLFHVLFCDDNVLFYILIVCVVPYIVLCVNVYYCHRVSTQLQLNISIHTVHPPSRSISWAYEVRRQDDVGKRVTK